VEGVPSTKRNFGGCTHDLSCKSFFASGEAWRDPSLAPQGRLGERRFEEGHGTAVPFLTNRARALHRQILDLPGPRW